MGKIDIRVFGGLMPSVKPRNLSNDSAKVAENLDLRFGDFRPTASLGSSIRTVAAGVKSIFRTPSGEWLDSTLDVDYAMDQAQGVSEERVILTGRSAYPEMWRLSDGYRKLGVPAPTAAPTVEVTTVDEFSTDEFNKARVDIPKQVQQMYIDSLTPALIGPTLGGVPTTTTTGWLAHGAVAGMPTQSSQQYAFCVPMQNVSGVYSLKDPDAHGLLQAPELNGKRITYLGNPYWAVPLKIRAKGQTINSTTLRAALKTIKNPMDGTSQLVPDSDVDLIIAQMNTIYSTTVEPMAALLAEVEATYQSMADAFNSAERLTTLTDGMKAFFVRSEVQAQITGLVGTSTGSSALTNNANAGQFTQTVAGHCYHIAFHNPSGTKSQITGSTRYFNPTDDGPTATNIRADFNSFITEDRRGAKVFNFEGMGQKIRDEMKIINNLRPDSEKWSPATIEAAITESLNIARQVFSDTNWAKNPAWPPATSRAGSQDAYAVTSARIAVEAAIDAVTEEYGAIRRRIEAYIYNDLFDKDVLVRLPKPVDRLLESRSYFYTYVNDLGQESAPSPPCAVFDCDQNDTVIVTAPAPPAGRFIRKMRLYRSSTSNTSTAFQFVIENATEVSDSGWSDPASRTLNDTFRQESLGEVCETLEWDEPPVDGTGLVSMPGGFFIMFDKTSVRPSESYVPYAYPMSYEQTMKYDFVAAGVVGQTAIILTKGSPYFCTGNDPSAISLQEIDSNQSCISKRSAYATEGGMFFASPDGLCMATISGGVQVISKKLYSRKDWQALNPQNSVGRYHDGCYYLFLASVCLKFDIEGMRLSQIPLAATAAFADLSTDTLYVVVGTALSPLYGGAVATGKWRSKDIFSPSGWRMAAARVESTFSAPVTMRLYADGVLYMTKSVTGDKGFKLKDKTPKTLNIEIESTSEVTRVILATSMEELGQE